MPGLLLDVLKVLLLVLLYLFFVRVVRAVWVEVDGPRPRRSNARRDRSATPAAMPSPAPSVVGPAGVGAPAGLVVIAPPEAAGRRYALDEELTLGRAPGCRITLDDTFVSQLHARVFEQAGTWFVEDLGSTNGTWIDRTRITTPTVLPVGAPLRVGRTTLQIQK